MLCQGVEEEYLQRGLCSPRHLLMLKEENYVKMLGRIQNLVKGGSGKCPPRTILGVRGHHPWKFVKFIGPRKCDFQCFKG